MGANAGLKVASLVAGMVAGAAASVTWRLAARWKSRVFARAYAPSTMGSFLRPFAFCHSPSRVIRMRAGAASDAGPTCVR
jgi:hypothetical protein